MRVEMNCAEVSDVAAEVALRIAPVEERDAALAHSRGCADCNRLMSDLSAVGDDLLLLAPERQPSPGFESRVLASLAGDTATSDERARPLSKLWLKVGSAVAALALVAALGSITTYVVTSADRELGASYRETLETSRGSSFGAAPLTGPEGRAGTVFAYEGEPSWVMVTFDQTTREGTYRVKIVTRDGEYRDLGTAHLGDHSRSWGAEVPVELSQVIQVRLTMSDGTVAFFAQVDPSRPWGT